MGRRVWRPAGGFKRRMFASLREGYRRGRGSRVTSAPVECHPVERPTLAAKGMEELIDGKLRAGLIETEKWEVPDGES